MTRTLLMLLAAASALGQEYHRHNFAVGGGAGFPVFTRSRSIWEDSALFSARYGFRFHRDFQADFAYTRVFSPADKLFDPEEPVIERRELGGGRIDAYLFGGRRLFRVRDRLLLSAGAGAVHERFRAPRLRFGPNLDQTGWGVYALVGISWTLDGSERFRISMTPRLEVVQSQEAWLHRNRWVMLPVEFGFSF